MNKVGATPTLIDLLNQHKRDIGLTLNCHAIGTITNFDPDTQRATVQVAYKKTFYVQQSQGGPYVRQTQDYPLLADLPVIFLGGGTIAQTFPVAQGDGCIVLFNDRDMDNWAKGGNNAETASNRLHSMSDGVVLVGLRSLATKLPGFDTARWLVKDQSGGAKVGLGGSKVLIGNDLVTLNSLLATLINAIEGLIIDLPPSPTAGQVNAAYKLVLENVKTQIAGLLE